MNTTIGNENALREQGEVVTAKETQEQATTRGSDHATLVSVNPKGEARIDSRLIASNIGIKHKNLVELVRKHQSDFDEFGITRFQTAIFKLVGKPEKFLMLNEDQAYLLLAYSRNTAKVRSLKIALVKAFRDARRAVEVRQGEYLPSYHALHDAIHARFGGSENERFMHMNANKAINKIAGVQPGERPTAGLLQQSILAVGSALAARAVLALSGGKPHQAIKDALQPLEGVRSLPCMIQGGA